MRDIMKAEWAKLGQEKRGGLSLTAVQLLLPPLLTPSFPCAGRKQEENRGYFFLFAALELCSEPAIPPSFAHGLSA